MMKILVVEDEEMIRRGIVLTVDWASLQCQVVAEAANGIEGLDAVKKYAPDLIITDLKMPRMDGIEMVRRLRDAGNTTAVIILTAYDSFPYAQSAVRLGAVDYLLKPFHDGDLENAVLRLRQRLSPLAQADPNTIKNKYVQDAVNYIRAHYSNPGISVGTIAGDLGISEGHLSHIFKKETGDTLLGYLTRCRIDAAMEQLRDHRVKIYEVAEQVGYRDIAYFSASFKKTVGMSPSEYQNSRFQ